jgi:hypothetical protein
VVDKHNIWGRLQDKNLGAENKKNKFQQIHSLVSERLATLLWWLSYKHIFPFLDRRLFLLLFRLEYSEQIFPLHHFLWYQNDKEAPRLSLMRDLTEKAVSSPHPHLPWAGHLFK